MQKINFNEALNQIISHDPRYDRDVYHFVREGLDYTVKLVKKNVTGKERHVSGQELLEGLRRFSLHQFGPMTKTVLNYWGVKRCEDFAEIVFNLVEKGVLGKTDQDSREDFKGGYDFEEAFVKPYLPPPEALLRRGQTSELRPTNRTAAQPDRAAGTEKLSSGSN
jgi:uncharacterized repeat protein (TIGR04138 family)